MKCKMPQTFGDKHLFAIVGYCLSELWNLNELNYMDFKLNIQSTFYILMP